MHWVHGKVYKDTVYQVKHIMKLRRGTLYIGIYVDNYEYDFHGPF